MFLKKNNYAIELASLCYIVKQVKLGIKFVKHMPLFFTVNGTYLNCFFLKCRSNIKKFFKPVLLLHLIS